MTTDQELLQRVHREATRRIRRRRAATSAVVVMAIIGLSATAAAVTGGGEHDKVETIAPDVTTTRAPSTTTTSTAPPATTSSTATPTTTTPTPTTTTPPVTTTAPAASPVTVTNQVGGLKVTVTASSDRSRPGRVELAIRVEDGHGSHPTGYVLWDGEAYTIWGDASTEDGTGDFPGWLFGECDEVMDDDPATNLRPDPAASVVSRTTRLSHEYGAGSGDVRIRLEVYTSLCSTDQESTPLELTVPIRT
jgi:hypothetical protein